MPAGSDSCSRTDVFLLSLYEFGGPALTACCFQFQHFFFFFLILVYEINGHLVSFNIWFFFSWFFFFFFFFLPIHVSKVFALPGLLLIKSDWFSQGLHVNSHDVIFFFFFFFLIEIDF